jgi:xanthine dehydrogenase accessory factor
MQSLSETLVLIKGAGDLATGVAARLRQSGFPVVMTELSNPLMVRRTVSFGEAVYEGEVTVEGIPGRLVPDVASARAALAECAIPVLVDPGAECLAELSPDVLVDAIMAKRNTGTRITDAPVVVALGPGFTAGVDCHAVVETNRGHKLGRAIYAGSAEPDTGEPGLVGGKTEERIVRAPVAGAVTGLAHIGDWVAQGQVVATVDGREATAGCSGVLRGLVRPGAVVSEGEKIGDVDPRAEPSHCYLISDKSLAIAGGVLEAILHLRERTCA